MEINHFSERELPIHLPACGQDGNIDSPVLIAYNRAAPRLGYRFDMPRDPRSSRLTQTSDAVASASAPETEAGHEPLVALLARYTRRVYLLPHLHRRALQV